ncbi:exonuclease SbcCD subunit D [Pseudidiomarina insulisalsae]|uniref:Nuclease SbcCD subunit D n=1 Tax=Pseudidiomarina insulisalsae TaxID=575789 RepID=A0A432YMN3_9GAMM|nr:exonuclease SbcCD subunit D [Pseudidiomarina insulisalsae]RUO62210.1 exonuclease sbcCD subunit D [Pseudidiomarina insulisalsae]
MKLLHTSDWHLGRIFNQQSLLDDQAHILKQIIDYAKVHEVDAVIVAGDIYDRALPSADAVSLLDRTLTSLIRELSIPVVMISGNHDGAQRLGFGSELLKHSGLHLFTSFAQLLQPVQLEASSGQVNIWGIPYCDPETVNDFFKVKTTDHQSAQEHVTGVLQEHIAANFDGSAAHVVVSHSFIAGADTSESERPLSIGGAECVDANLFKDFAYTALGHLHQAQFRGYAHVRYSGSPLKYSFSEVKQKKSVTLVTIADDKSVTTELLPLRAIRDVRVLEGKFDQLLGQGKDDPAADDYLQIKLTDKEAILDPLARLRTVYPNILDLTKVALEREATTNKRTREQLGRQPIEIINDFYKEMTSDSLSEEQTKLLTDILSELNKATDDA